jgi:hypothetical protein
MLRWTLGLVVAAILTGFTVLLLHGEYSHEGDVVLTLSAARGWGVHRGDILVAGGWLTGLVALAKLVVVRPSPGTTETAVSPPAAAENRSLTSADELLRGGTGASDSRLEQ